MKKQHLSLITLALVASIMMGCKASSTKAQAANDIKEAQAADTLVVNTDSCILQEGIHPRAEGDKFRLQLRQIFHVVCDP